MRKQKNVVVIICDQLRKDCLQPYGNDYVKTPALQQLAQEGITFDRCYVANPVCMPNRMSIFSGMYPRSHGLWSNGVKLEDTGKTGMHHLLQHGYGTASIGKIHFEPTQDKTGDVSKESEALWRNVQHHMKETYWGYEHVDMTLNHGTVLGDYLRWFYENGGEADQLKVDIEAPATGHLCTPKALHYSNFVGEKSCAYLENRNKEKPFFLCVSFPDPHLPFYVPSDMGQDRPVKTPVGCAEDLAQRPSVYEAHRQSDVAVDQNPKFSITQGDLAKKRLGYTYDLVELIDENVQRVVDALKQEGVYEDTILLFVSDHGDYLGDHGLWRKGKPMYEGLISTPLIMVDHQHKNQRSAQLVSSVDIMPMIFGALEIDVPYYMDGKNVLCPDTPRSECFVEYREYHTDNIYALITDRYKYAQLNTGEYELTDLEKDPEERCNVATDPAYQQVLQEMRFLMLNHLLCNPSKAQPKMFGW